jgi:hypothetical protein
MSKSMARSEASAPAHVEKAVELEPLGVGEPTFATMYDVGANLVEGAEVGEDLLAVRLTVANQVGAAIAQ